MVTVLAIEVTRSKEDLARKRVTLQVATARNNVIPCRLYEDGKLTGIVVTWEGTTIEYTLASDFKAATLKFIHVHRSNLLNGQSVLFP